MKDKKTIAIVTLAAITAGFAIFSFANNNNKLKEYSELKAEKDELDLTRQKIQTERDELRTQRDQLDVHGKSLEEKVTVQAEQLVQLNKEVEAQNQQVAQKTDEIEAMKLQHAQDLGEKEAKLQEAKDSLTKSQGELKVQTELAVSKAKEAEKRGKSVLDLESKNKDLNIEKIKLEQERVKLQAEIDKTNKLLEESQGSREALRKELAVLEEAKAELDRQMADIFFIEARYKAIKSEIAIARRLDWMRRGVGVYKNRKPLDEVNPTNIVLKNQNPPGESSEEKQVAAKASGSAAESVSVELTSDGRVIIDGKLIEPTKTEKPIDAPKE
tara:strand:+ start:2179 stop:3162 length:984 start_codon:yes stop_codon:yes gene_type:complete